MTAAQGTAVTLPAAASVRLPGQAVWGPIALGVALAPLDGPLPSCLLTWALAWGLSQLWHRRWMPWVRRRGWLASLAGDHAALNPQLARVDLASLAFYVLAWLPVGGVFVALALVLWQRTAARMALGMERADALGDVLRGVVVLLGAAALGQLLLMAGFYVWSAGV